MKVELEGRDGRICGYLTHAHKQHKTASLGPTLIASFGLPTGSIHPTEVSIEEDIAEQLASSSGWSVFTFTPEGVANSGGSFSLSSWSTDLYNVVGYLAEEQTSVPIVFMGFDLYASIATDVFATESRLAGLISISPIFNLGSAEVAASVIQAAKLQGVDVTTEELDSQEFQGFSRHTVSNWAEKVGDRPWMMLQSTPEYRESEETIRQLSEVCPKAEFHQISAPGDSLRSDPRVLAIAMGWLERTF